MRISGGITSRPGALFIFCPCSTGRLGGLFPDPIALSKLSVFPAGELSGNSFDLFAALRSLRLFIKGARVQILLAVVVTVVVVFVFVDIIGIEDDTLVETGHGVVIKRP